MHPQHRQSLCRLGIAKKADSELDNIANELARAKSLEDMDELAAETLFGEELSLAAAQFAKSPGENEPANEPLEKQVAAGKVVPNGSGLGKASVEVTLEGSSTQEEGGMDISASQRLKTVRALNADLHPSLREPGSSAANDAPSASLEATEPIEDQINISMTQTLESTHVRPPITTSDSTMTTTMRMNRQRMAFSAASSALRRRTRAPIETPKAQWDFDRFVNIRQFQLLDSHIINDSYRR